MIEGIDAELDQIGVVLTKDIVCGECLDKMIPLSNGRYKCIACGIVFDNEAN
jgi:hypothetical protein